MNSTGVFLGDFVDREVRNVDVGAESGFERGTDGPQLFPYNAAEEGVVLDLSCAAVLAAVASNTVLGVTQEAIKIKVSSSSVIRFSDREGETYLLIKDSDSRERTSSSGK